MSDFTIWQLLLSSCVDVFASSAVSNKAAHKLYSQNLPEAHFPVYFSGTQACAGYRAVEHTGHSFVLLTPLIVGSDVS